MKVIGRAVQAELLRQHSQLALTYFAVLFFLLFAVRTTCGQGLLSPSGPPGPTMCSLEEICSNVPPSRPLSSSGVANIYVNPNGNYHLTQNISVPPGYTNALEIAGSNVTIDLNGFSVEEGINGSAIYIYPGVTNVVLKNGFIKGGLKGLGASHVRIENVIFIQTQSIISLGQAAKLIGDSLVGDGTATNPAVTVGNRSVVSDCRVMNWGMAAGAFCFQSGDDCKFDRCTAEGGYIGFKCGKFNTCVDCNAHTNSDAGFSCDAGSVVRFCQSHDNGGDCFKLMENCTLENSTATGCGRNGVNLAGNYCRVEHDKVDQCNTSGDTGSSGIAIKSSNGVVLDCTITRCLHYAVFVYSPYTNNLVGDCVASGNGGAVSNYQAWNFTTNVLGPQVTSISSVQFRFPLLSLP